MTNTNDAASPAATIPPFRQPKVGLRWAGFVLALTGWCLSLALFLATDARSTGGLLDTLCGGADEAASGWNCRSVLASEQSKIRLGPSEGGLQIPVATFGMAYFAFVGLWYLFIGPPTSGRGAYHALLTAVVVLGVWESITFLRIMAFELHQWCLLCVITHVLNFGLLVVTIWAWPGKPPAPAFRPHPTGRLALATLTAGLLAGFAHLAVVVISIQGGWLQQVGDAYRRIVDDPVYVTWNYARQPQVNLNIRTDDVWLGDPDAPHTVVIFSDFQCTQCRRAHEVLAELATQRDDVRITYRHFPQDPACNPHPDFQAGGHPAACRAARAFEAARLVGGPDGVRRMWHHLYERQAELERADFANWAADLGLDQPAFMEALTSSAAVERIEADINRGLAIDISAVPVLYLDGRRVIGWTRPETWDALLTER